MIKNTINKTLIGLGLAQMLSNPLCAQEDDSGCCERFVMVGEPIDPLCVDPIYPYPATIDPSCSWEIYARGEFLYFSSSLDSYVNAASNITFDLSELAYLFPKTPYRPGFRVAVGLDLGSALLDLTYLRYHSHTTSHFSATDGAGVMVNYSGAFILAPVFGENRLFFQTVESALNLHLDYGVISLQKPVYMGKRILMNLTYGLMGLWTSQRYKFTCTALENPPPLGVTSSGISSAIHKAWAVGPNLGFQATGLLPYNFKALLNIDLSLQYGNCYQAFSTGFFPDAQTPFFDTLANATVKQKGNSAHLQAFHGGAIGLGWGDYLFCDRYHLDLYVTYNFLFQHIFNYSVAVTAVGFDGMNLSNYSIHGIAIGGRIDF